jgi:hypothetical protein
VSVVMESSSPVLITAGAVSHSTAVNPNCAPLRPSREDEIMLAAVQKPRRGQGSSLQPEMPPMYARGPSPPSTSDAGNVDNAARKPQDIRGKNLPRSGKIERPAGRRPGFPPLGLNVVNHAATGAEPFQPDCGYARVGRLDKVLDR